MIEAEYVDLESLGAEDFQWLQELLRQGLQVAEQRERTRAHLRERYGWKLDPEVPEAQVIVLLCELFARRQYASTRAAASYVEWKWRTKEGKAFRQALNSARSQLAPYSEQNEQIRDALALLARVVADEEQDAPSDSDVPRVKARAAGRPRDDAKQRARELLVAAGLGRVQDDVLERLEDRFPRVAADTPTRRAKELAARFNEQLTLITNERERPGRRPNHREAERVTQNPAPRDADPWNDEVRQRYAAFLAQLPDAKLGSLHAKVNAKLARKSAAR